MTSDGHKPTGSLFKVPLLQRIIGRTGGFYKKEVCMELDGVGFFLHIEEEGQQYDKDWIRRHLVLRDRTYTLVEAEDLQGAIRRIINEWDGCKVGGESEESKALWINRKEPIKELPPCESYWLLEDRAEVMCGKPSKDPYCGGAGCIFSGFDAPEGCPGDVFCEKVGKDLINGHWVDKVKPNLVTVDGLEYQFITWRSL